MSGNLQLPPPHVLPFAAALSATGGIGGYPAGLGTLPYPVFPAGLPHPPPPPPPPPGLGPPPPGLGPLQGPAAPSSRSLPLPPLSSAAYHGGFQQNMTSSSHAPADCINTDGQQLFSLCSVIIERVLKRDPADLLFPVRSEQISLNNLEKYTKFRASAPHLVGVAICRSDQLCRR